MSETGGASAEFVIKCEAEIALLQKRINGVHRKIALLDDFGFAQDDEDFELTWRV